MKGKRVGLALLLVLVMAFSGSAVAGCGGSGSGGAGGGGASAASQTFDLSGVSLEIDTTFDLAKSDGYFDSYIGNTNMKNGSQLWAGSTLSGDTLANSANMDDNLVVMLKISGSIADMEAVVQAATLTAGSDVLEPVLAWANSEYLILHFKAPDTKAKVAFIGSSGDSIKLAVQ